jgi:hypothetical protein
MRQNRKWQATLTTLISSRDFHGFAFKLEVKFQIWMIYIHHFDIVTKCTQKWKPQHDTCIIFGCPLLFIYLFSCDVLMK